MTNMNGNVHDGSATAKVALNYMKKGWSPIPVPFRKKAPQLKGWQNLRLDAASVFECFGGEVGIGVLLGEASGGLVDVDLDCAEAIKVADHLLPHTAAVFGRASTPASHRLFVSPGAAYEKLTDPTKAPDDKRACLVELRAGPGKQTVFPPSIHPSGEPIAWAATGEPTVVTPDILRARVRAVAACALLARHWPTRGRRHDAALALAGALVRAGWRTNSIEDFMRAVCLAACDEEVDDRVATVATTAEKLKAGRPATGMPRLSDILDKRVVERVVDWLGLRNDRPKRRLGVDDADDADAGNADEKPPKLAEQVAALVEDHPEVELFHDPSDVAWAVIPVGKRRACVRLASRTMRAWISRTTRTELGFAPSPATVDAALVSVDATARFDGPEHEVHLRVAEHEGAIVVDLGDDSGRCIRVTGDGWQLVDAAPVMFQRSDAMRALPCPARGGSLDDLAPFVNVDKDGLKLLAAWLVAAFRPGLPFPVLAVHGEQGTAKSTASRVARGLVDPNKSPVRAAPRAEDDLIVSATSSHVIAFDNLSGVQPWLSDALCRMATGGGISKRRLYTDDEEIIIDVKRPVIINGIDDVATRPDLAERCLVLTLQPIATEKRKDERTFWRAFEQAAPRILGVVLDGIASALRKIDGVRIAELPRLADFALWICAAEEGLGLKSGDMLAAYKNNQKDAINVALRASPVASAVLGLLDDSAKGRWAGTPGELLAVLRAYTTEAVMRTPAWPTDTYGLSTRLRRVAAFLRQQNVVVQLDDGRTAAARHWCIYRLPHEQPATASSTSPASSATANDADDPDDADTGVEQNRGPCRDDADDAHDADAVRGDDAGPTRQLQILRSEPSTAGVGNGTNDTARLARLALVRQTDRRKLSSSTTSSPHTPGALDGAPEGAKSPPKR